MRKCLICSWTGKLIKFGKPCISLDILEKYYNILEETYSSKSPFEAVVELLINTILTTLLESDLNMLSWTLAGSCSPSSLQPDVCTPQQQQQQAGSLASHPAMCLLAPATSTRSLKLLFKLFWRPCSTAHTYIFVLIIWSSAMDLLLPARTRPLRVTRGFNWKGRWFWFFLSFFLSR